jgi:hypothetical protein
MTQDGINIFTFWFFIPEAIKITFAKITHHFCGVFKKNIFNKNHLFKMPGGAR